MLKKKFLTCFPQKYLILIVIQVKKINKCPKINSNISQVLVNKIRMKCQIIIIIHREKRFLQMAKIKGTSFIDHNDN